MKRKIDLLKAMRTFIIVAENQSFSAAARDLGIVASAISRQVSDLEQHFSCQLLYRTTRAVQLTPEGTYYIEQFKEVINRLDELQDTANKRQQKIAGLIRVSAPVGSESLGFLKGASDFMKAYPEVRISWLFANRFVNIIQEGIDLAIRVGELSDSNFIARRYSSTQVHFVANPSYLSEMGTPKHPRELQQHQCLLDSSNRQPGRWRYMENNKENQIQVSAFIEANEGSVIARFAADGHGIAYLPTFLMQGFLDSGELVPILPEFSFKAAPVSFVYPANRLTNPTLQTFINYLIENKLQ